jgi:hypothetical protein
MASAIENLTGILSSTPRVLRHLLAADLADTAIPESSREEWEPYDIIGHLVHGEITDWVPRAKIILEQDSTRSFEPFDRFAQFEHSKGKTLNDLLDEFETLRADNLATLVSWQLDGEQLRLSGTHPELGRVTLGQLLTTWAVHDLNHIRQIATAIAKRYHDDVGPWRQYLGILK